MSLIFSTQKKKKKSPGIVLLVGRMLDIIYIYIYIYILAIWCGRNKDLFVDVLRGRSFFFFGWKIHIP